MRAEDDHCPLGRVSFCRDFRESFWELPLRVPPAWRRGLLGWNGFDRDADGVPVAHLLAAALVRNALVTFPVGIRPPLGDRFLRPLIRRRWCVGRHFFFIHTTEVDVARSLFDVDCFDWTQGGQFVFLSPVGVAAPLLTEAELDPSDEPDFDRLAARGVTGLVLAGVDGVVAGLYASEEALRSSVVESLQAACKAMGAEWCDVDEHRFRELLQDDLSRG